VKGRMENIGFGRCYRRRVTDRDPTTEAMKQFSQLFFQIEESNLVATSSRQHSESMHQPKAQAPFSYRIRVITIQEHPYQSLYLSLHLQPIQSHSISS